MWLKSHWSQTTSTMRTLARKTRTMTRRYSRCSCSNNSSYYNSNISSNSNSCWSSNSCSNSSKKILHLFQCLIRITKISIILTWPRKTYLSCSKHLRWLKSSRISSNNTTNNCTRISKTNHHHSRNTSRICQWRISQTTCQILRMETRILWTLVLSFTTKTPVVH